MTGAVIWVAILVYGGYFFGTREVVQHNFTLVIMAIIGVSLLPIAAEFVKARWTTKRWNLGGNAR